MGCQRNTKEYPSNYCKLVVEVAGILYLQIVYNAARSSSVCESAIHCWTSRHSLGFEDEELGSSPSWWAATVATYCPSRPGELPKSLSSKPCE